MSDEHILETPGWTPADRRLESWKEVAAYLGRDVRTVQRLERREGLPVHRVITRNSLKVDSRPIKASVRPSATYASGRRAPVIDAIASEPTFARAHVGPARAYWVLGTIRVGALPAESQPPTIAAATRALDLDPNLADALRILAEAHEQPVYDAYRADPRSLQVLARVGLD